MIIVIVSFQGSVLLSFGGVSSVFDTYMLSSKDFFQGFEGEICQLAREIKTVTCVNFVTFFGFL